MNKFTKFNGVSFQSNENVMDEVENITKVFTTDQGGEIIVDMRGVDEATVTEVANLLDVEPSVIEDNMVSIYS
jgi:hypothetical protein